MQKGFDKYKQGMHCATTIKRYIQRRDSVGDDTAIICILLILSIVYSLLKASQPLVGCRSFFYIVSVKQKTRHVCASPSLSRHPASLTFLTII